MGLSYKNPGFCGNGRIFATLGYPDAKWGALTLTPEQQEHYVGEDPGTFVPAAGAWGRAGSTTVKLASADEAMIREAIRLAWENTAKKRKRKAARRPRK